MTKEQFEAHVRAGAWDKYPVQGWADPRDAELFDSLNKDQENRQAAYIASRMEHEWPLVGFTAKLLEYWKAGNFSRHPWQMELQDILSPYTTKQIEP